MKEHPILFSGEMVRAILDGRKTMTRRVIRIANTIHSEETSINHNSEITDVVINQGDLWNLGLTWTCVGIQEHDCVTIKCPYGQPGDRLWVRETWCHETDFGTATGKALYRSDGDKREKEHGACWRPSIHMPRWASRIALEVMAVRVERLQEITEADAKAEGSDAAQGCGEAVEGSTYTTGFNMLWDSINAKRGYGWAVDPWVWVIEFRQAAGNNMKG